MQLMVCIDGVEHATVPLRDGDDPFNREAERGALDRAYEAKASNPDAVVSVVIVDEDPGIGDVTDGARAFHQGLGEETT